MMTSMLLALKNQKRPVSTVSVTAMPLPVCPAPVANVARTWKRLLFRHSVVASVVQAPGGGAEPHVRFSEYAPTTLGLKALATMNHVPVDVRVNVMRDVKLPALAWSVAAVIAAGSR